MLVNTSPSWLAWSQMLQGHHRHQGGDHRNKKTDKKSRIRIISFPARTARSVLRWQRTRESFPDAAQVDTGSVTLQNHPRRGRKGQGV